MGSDDARQLDIPLKGEVTPPMVDTLASLGNLERSHLYADYVVGLANSKWIWEPCNSIFASYVNSLWNFYSKKFS